MNSLNQANVNHCITRHSIEVADETLSYRSIVIDDVTPTGNQIAIAAGFKPVQNVIILQELEHGGLEDIRPEETVNLNKQINRFIIIESDRTFNFMIDGIRFSWPRQVISEITIRQLGKIDASKAISLERKNEADLLLASGEVVNLDQIGTESFVTRIIKNTWQINVQGTIIEVDTPSIIVRDAIERAGLNPNQGWQIFLKIEGQPKQEKQLADVIDLMTPGIEKLRLTPQEVNNGESSAILQKTFELLDTDYDHLNQMNLPWETVISNGQRWLLIHNYNIPDGYNAKEISLALEIPHTYPQAQIDMFYVLPALNLQTGQPIGCTETTTDINGKGYQRWSRHRGANSTWNPTLDNVRTHLALVEGALIKEVEV
ncbi:MAG: prokaryotic E2 family E [Moraxellaceae bacterium]|nr:MAG: prokaryotic E2 family E [Moraxellaceae bacterium]